MDVENRVSAKTLKILNYLYERVETLEEFVKRLPGADHLEVIRPNDGSRYVGIIQNTLIGTPSNCRPLPQNLVFLQLSKQCEVLVRVIEKLLREGKRTNLLTIGYNFISEKKNVLVWISGRIEHSHSNQNTSRLLYSPWKILLERIGDEAMAYLLETRAIFLCASKSCYMQLTGLPLYELQPFKRLSATLKKARPVLKQLKTSRLRYSQKQKQNLVNAKKHPASKLLPVSAEVLESHNRVCSCARNTGSEKEDFECSIDQNSKTECEVNTTEHFIGSIDAMDGIEEVKKPGLLKRKVIGDESCMPKRRKLTETSPVEMSELSEHPGNDTSSLNLSLLTSSESFKSACDILEEESFKSACGILEEELRTFENAADNLSSCNDITLSTCNSKMPCYEELQSVISLTKVADADIHLNTDLNEVLQEFVPMEDSQATENLAGTNETSADFLIRGSHKNTALDSSSCSSAEVENGETTSVKVPIICSETFNPANKIRKKNRRHRKKSTITEKSAKGQPPAFNRTLVFERSKMLYCNDLREHFPPKYVLPVFSVDKIGAQKLMEKILQRNNSKNSGFNCPPETEQNLTDLLLSLLRNHKKCRYRYLLSYNCDTEFMLQKGTQKQFSNKLEENTKSEQGLAAPVFVRGLEANCLELNKEPKCSSEKQELDASYSRLFEQNVSTRKVFLFVRSCIVRVIPLELIGSNCNKQVFLKNVEKFLSLGRFESISLGEMMCQMKVGCCSWMKHLKSNSSRQHLLAKLLFWLVDEYVVPLVYSYFYVTEKLAHRNQLFYYRKKFWNRIYQKGLKDYLSCATLQPLSEAEAKEMISSEKSLGISFLRFLPKANSLRPVVNMCRKQTLPKAKETTINGQLQNLLQVLKYETQCVPGRLGASVSSVNDIYKSWRHFLLARKQRGDVRPLYFVKVDIKNCYDSINQELLYGIVKDILNRPKDYNVRRYASVFASDGKLQRTFHREACCLAKFEPSFLQHVTGLIQNKAISNTIFVDQVWQTRVDSESMLAKLKSHVFRNIVKAGHRLYLQTAGIGQGSSISSILCNIYYAEMETKYIICKTDDLLMRQTDDFIFITPDKNDAVGFLELMMNGIAAYNCYINHEKTLINFDYSDPNVTRLAEGALFPWCGLLINPLTLDVQPDYARYSGVCIRDTLSVDASSQPGFRMRARLMFSMRSKSHPMYLSCETNSVEVVIENIYKLFLLTAFKFHWYARELPVSAGTTRNPLFFINLIFELSDFVYEMLEKNSVAASALEKSVIRLICFRAFSQKLARHSTAYQGILTALKSQSGTLEQRMKPELLGALQRVTGNTMPKEFQLIVR